MFYTVDHLKAKLREPSKLWRKILKSLMVLDIIYKTSKGYGGAKMAGSGYWVERGERGSIGINLSLLD